MLKEFGIIWLLKDIARKYMRRRESVTITVVQQWWQ